jgi:hydroxymethylpyrimidine/phosphomethylpyrimidine kinase
MIPVQRTGRIARFTTPVVPGFPPVCLSIGSADSSGSSGIQGDLKTCTALGVMGVSAVTAVDARSFSARGASHVVPDACIRGQLDAVIAQMPIAVVKVGHLPSVGAVRTVTRWLREHPRLQVVVDPSATDSRGIALLQPEVLGTLCDELLPRATLCVPNRFEAALLAGMEECLSVEDMEQAARTLSKRHGAPVLVTGGGLAGRSIDVLAALDGVSHYDGQSAPRAKVHGAGCAHSAAIAAHLARGESLREAIMAAKFYIGAAIAAAPTLPDGHGTIWHGSAAPAAVPATPAAPGAARDSRRISSVFDLGSAGAP